MSLPAAAEPSAQPTLNDLATRKWKSSGLSDSHAKRLRLQVLTGPQTKVLGSSFHGIGSLKIPYFDFKGKPTTFYRVRYLEDLPGFAGLTEKPQRYAQPPGTLNEVYLPPLLEKSWEEIAGDASIQVLVTEGEFKAAAGCAEGFATIGLGGVDVWRSTKRGLDFLPQLDKVKWEGRSVVIVFDSDAATNPHVVRAQRQLARELLARGAQPTIASLPPAKGGGKQGLDDYLCNNAPKGLEKIIRDAPFFPEADALWGMNEEVIFVRDPGLVVERESGLRMDPSKFATQQYANRHFIETIEKNGKMVQRKAQLAPRWMQWERRMEADRMTYKPGQGRLAGRTWNTWTGWGVEEKKGDVSPWSWLLDHLFKDDRKSREWFERWCAYPIQHPGTKMYTAALLWGTAKGTGKTMIAYSLMKVYGENAIEIKNKDLKGSFNSWAQNRQFVYGDEITASEARVDAEWLKGLITQHSVKINVKYLPEYVIPDCMNYLFTSNRPDALFVEDGDRRFFIHEVLGIPLERAFYEKYDQWLHGEGPRHLLHHLRRLPLGEFNPREHAPTTMAKERMIRTSKNEISLWVQDLREAPAQALAPLLSVFGEQVIMSDLFTSKMLLKAFDPEDRTRFTEIALGKAMQTANIPQVNGGKPVRVKEKLIRLYAVRNIEHWLNAKPNEIAKHFLTHFGPETQRY